MTEQFLIGLIGTGVISQRAHIPAWNEVDGVTVAAIAEPDADNRSAAIELLADDVETYEDYESLLDEMDVDLVDITIPPQGPLVPLNFSGNPKGDAIRTAIQNQVPVTCQKPFAEDLETATNLVETAEEQSVALSINQQARFAQAFARGREYVDRGLLGDLRTIQIRSDFQLHGYRFWLYCSVHTYDLVRYWANTEPERVMAWFPQQTEDNRHVLAVWLDFGDGTVATIWDEFSSSTNLRWEFRLMGDDGSLRGHETYGEMIPARTVYTPANELSETIEPVTMSYIPDAFRAYFQTLIGALRKNDPIPVSARDNLETLRIAFAVKQSFETKGWVSLEDIPESA